jgi:hypothetical protein
MMDLRCGAFHAVLDGDLKSLHTVEVEMQCILYFFLVCVTVNLAFLGWQ